MKGRIFIIIFSLAKGSLAGDWNFSGSLESTLWVTDDLSPGLLDFDDDVFFAPSLSFSLDYQHNDYLYFHTTLTADRGFDAGIETNGDIRVDTLYLGYRPYGDNNLNFQVGKFATVVGNWAYQYEDNPFLLAPLPYAAISGVNTQNIEQLSGQAIENRANGTAPNIYANKSNWSSVIWGPSYSNGISTFGSIKRFDYALEIKNTSIGSSSEQWDFGEGDFSDPLIAGRLGYRPDASLTYGVSFSHSPYLDEDAFEALSPDFDRGDFSQTLIGVDARWARGKWILSGEAFFANYDRDGEDLKIFSYYGEARYKVVPGVWLASRFGQTITNEVAIPSGGQAAWGPDIIRGELAISWRFNHSLTAQAQYTYSEITNDIAGLTPEPHLFGVSVSLDF